MLPTSLRVSLPSPRDEGQYTEAEKVVFRNTTVTLGLSICFSNNRKVLFQLCVNYGSVTVEMIS